MGRQNMQTTRTMLEKKYLLARGTTKYDHLSDVELCLGVLANDQEATRDFAELYRAYILGDYTVNPIINIALKYET